MLHIIVNPASSSGRGARVWKAVEKQIREDGQPYAVHFSTPVKGIEQICEEITSDGQENTLLILGGDGSMNEAVNGIRNFERTRVGFLQIGSGNDLQRDMHLPKDQREIIASVLRGQVVRRCDVGEVLFHDRHSILPGWEDPRYARRLFNVGCGIGFDAECCWAAASSRFKSVLNALRLGKLIYLAAAIRLIFTSQMADCEITFEGGTGCEADGGAGVSVGSDAGNASNGDAGSMSESGAGSTAGVAGGGAGNTSHPEGTSLHYKKLLFAACMNHQYQGGGFRFCPHASADDGRIDLCTASDIARPNFFRIFPHAYNGGHLRYRGVTEERSVSFTIRTDRPLWVQTDGEVTCRSSHITVRLLPGQLRLVI